MNIKVAFSNDRDQLVNITPITMVYDIYDIYIYIHIYNVAKTIMNHPPGITIFIAGFSTIPSPGW